ncbi:MAG: ABC transporter ATP-binding protein/permease [Clostridiales bacterium]|jgi:ATP-binding cassette subfamily B protein|nr:ABC transporter ATP-binding protein/permease [Clostridiales bacterium]
MLRLARYLKPYILNIALIVALLFLQANNELSLPGYMSDIVNTGIANSGIESRAPEIISSGAFRKLLDASSEDEKAIILNYYSEAAANPKFPKAAGDGAFSLNKKNDSVIDGLIAEKAAVIMGTNMPGGAQAENQEGYTGFSLVNFARLEYQTLGADLESIQMSYILTTGGIMLLRSLASLVCVVLVAFITAKVVASMAKTIRDDVFRKVVSFSSSEFNGFSTSSLITRCTNDITQVSNMFNMGLRMIIFAPILGIGGIIRVLNYNKEMSVIVIISVVIIIALVMGMFRFAIPKFKIIQQVIDTLNKITREFLSGMLVIRAFNTQKYEEARFDKTNRELTDLNLFISRVMVCMMPMMMLIMNFTTVAILWFGAPHVANNLLEVGDIMAFIQYAMQIMMSFLMISMISVMMPRAAVSSQRISEVLDTGSSIENPENPKDFTGGQKGAVEFKNVTFKYPDADEYILKGINFIAKPGETTALIGSNGSGKSTLVNLIPRFYDIDEGQILIEGVDIRDVGLHDLRRKVAFIPQKAFLFSGTIESNIKFSDQAVSDEGMVKAAKISQAYSFIMEKEEKFQAPIAQSGSNVSGGQRQRLAIARAVAKQSDILIFDDSFSALDYKTDKALRDALKNELKGSTVLIVAQRVSTIRNAEQIIVLDEGEVAGIGKHNDLLKNCEVYRQIAASQLSKEELENE